MTRIICGVDIASSSLAARIGQDGAAASFANTSEGIAELAAFCETHRVALVAMEATGGYEQRAFAQLSEHGLPVAVVNPRAVRQFAQSMGSLEKTDAIDAGMIAWYAQTRQSQPLCLAPPTQLELRARVTRLRQLTEVRTAQLNQQRLVTNPAIQNSFHQMLKFLATQIEELQQAIAALIAGDVAMFIVGTSTAVPFVKAGTVLGFAVTSPRRIDSLPDVPTMIEAGYPGQTGDTPVGIYVQTGTPKEIGEILRAKVLKIIAMPDVKQRLAAVGFVPIGDTPEEFAAYLKTESDKWGKVIRDGKITLQ